MCIRDSQYINNEIEIGVLAEFIIYVNMLTWPVAVVGWITSIVQQAEASQKRINYFLNEEPEIKDGIEVANQIKGTIELENLSYVYPETKISAIKKVNLKIASGSTLGIIGNIGSGKSTLLELITRLYDPVEGTIKIDGLDIKKYSLRDINSDCFKNFPTIEYLLTKNLFKKKIHMNIIVKKIQPKNIRSTLTNLD